MKLEIKDTALKDLKHWINADRKKVKRIFKLLEDVEKHPYEGIGKPEPLKYQLQGYWSRRIDLEHRLVYSVAEDIIIVYSCRYHYK